MLKVTFNFLLGSLTLLSGFVISGSAFAQNATVDRAAPKSTLPTLKVDSPANSLLVPINKKPQQVSQTDNQVPATPVSQLSDVKPTDWEYIATAKAVRTLH